MHFFLVNCAGVRSDWHSQYQSSKGYQIVFECRFLYNFFDRGRYRIEIQHWHPSHEPNAVFFFDCVRTGLVKVASFDSNLNRAMCCFF